MHTYEYDSSVFRRKITLTASFCAFILLYSIIQLITGKTPFLWIGAILISGYFVWETFISIANPSKVEIDDVGITFSAYNKSHHYDWADVKRFRTKPLASGTKIFLRINEAGIFRGRYWVNCYYFSDGNELFKFLYNKEIEIEPDGLKARAVKSNQEANKVRKAKKKARWRK